MPTQILAVGTNKATSNDVVVAANSQLTVALKDSDGPSVKDAFVSVQLKDDAGQYFTIDHLTATRPALVIAAGTYRFVRRAGGSCGVFSG